MTELALRSGRTLVAWWSGHVVPNARKIALVLVIALLLGSSPAVAGLVMQAMADAYVQVSVFVAATLALFFLAERALKVDLGEWMARNALWQPAIAAFLGALPGCGGAIVVVTQYTRGYASFGALVSVLVATMGDAAFLLIAQEPATAALVLSVSFVAGTITGMISDAVHGRDFMRAKADHTAIPKELSELRPPFFPRWAKSLWFALLAPGLVVGGLEAAQVDPDAVVGVDGFTLWFGFLAAGFALVLWSLSGNGASHPNLTRSLPLGERVALDTNFVTAWVIVAFLAYELAVYAFGVDVSLLFRAWAPIMPLIGMLVGFVPGCGPQIVVTTLYLAGAIPLSAQFANAISNDGDALFPAIALAPRAAVVATLYSAIPALVVGYAWFFLFE